MRKFIHFSLMLAFIFLFCGCAQSYYALNPPKVLYSTSNNLEDITLNYHYDILRDKGNTKISKKERKHNVKLVAVKITNNTDKVINIGNNAAFFNGSTMVFPMDAISTKNDLKQSVPSHLFYLLLTPLTLSVNGSNPFPIGLILGPVISGGNMLVAANANSNLYKELVQYDILYRDIQPGETVFGLVGFRNLDYVPLTIKLIK
jgi:archaellum component FlaF (FlaF/FlaG flagellin family)